MATLTKGQMSAFFNKVAAGDLMMRALIVAKTAFRFEKKEESKNVFHVFVQSGDSSWVLAGLLGSNKTELVAISYYPDIAKVFLFQGKVAHRLNAQHEWVPVDASLAVSEWISDLAREAKRKNCMEIAINEAANAYC